MPATNADITKAMSTNGKLLDSHLTRTNALLAKAMVPLATMVADIGQGKGKAVNSYFDSINSSVRMLAAAFNYLNQTRKEVVRMHVREQSLTSLCKWDCPVGQDELFPFDVTKRCDEIGKVRTLGSNSGQNQKKFFRKPATSNNMNDFKWPPRQYQRQSFNPYNRQGKGNTNKPSKPFLGKKGSNDRHKKRF